MQVIVALVPIIGGIVVGIGGWFGWREQLTRDGVAGVRTSATMRSDEAFRIGNRVAGLPTIAAGLVGVAAGVAAFAMPTGTGLIVAAILGILGMLGLVFAGGVLGHRAAATVPEPAPVGCGGCACGAGGCAAAG